MASLAQVCLALLLVSCVQGQAPSYLSSLTAQCTGGTFSSQVSNCSLALYNSIRVSSSADIDTIYDALCNNIPAVGTYNGCLRNVFETCLSSEFFSLLQTDAGTRDTNQYYCDHKSEFNQACLSAAISSDSCTANAGSMYINAISQVGLVRATCNFMETLRGCVFNLGASCSNHNRNVYDTYWVKNYPPACAGGTRSIPTSFLLLGACAMLLNKMVAAFLF